MKAILYLITLLLAGNTMPLNTEKYNDTYREIELSVNGDGRSLPKNNDTDPKDGPRTRGVVLQPVYAYIYNGVISIDFTKTFSNVSVTIINETTGEIVYSETSNNSTNFNIDLNNESQGNYLIEIDTNNIRLKGNFAL